MSLTALPKLVRYPTRPWILREPVDEIRPPGLWRNQDEIRWSARHWAARIGVELKTITIRPMPNKWASVSTAGRLTLDASLLDLPRDLGEFVLVHELVHLLCPKAGHGPIFKSFMSAYLPDWEARLRNLQERASQAPPLAEGPPLPATTVSLPSLT